MAAKAKTKADLDLPEDILDPEVAYYDSLYPSRNTPATQAEIRRAYAMDIAAELTVYGQTDKMVPLAADIEAYLKEGKVPGRGVREATALVTAMDDKGKIIR